MTKEEWAECQQPTAMLQLLLGTKSHRKCRLFGCLLMRTISEVRADAELLCVLEVAERFADGLASEMEIDRQHAVITSRVEELIAQSDFERAAIARDVRLCFDPRQKKWLLNSYHRRRWLPEDTNLIREIFSNPIHPVAPDPNWQSETVLALATRIYAERAFDRMPILADALEEAGCDNADILSHCRGDGPHVRGCWVVDLLLDRE